MNARASDKSGWVPIRLSLHGEPSVDWCWLGRRRFTAPFFDDTIELAQRLPFNTLFTHRTPIAELGAWFDAGPGLLPSGFIFHMSRCGSTLVSRMLAELPENVVISEAGPLDKLARAASLPDELRTRWLRWMVSALGQKRAGGESRCFIKFDSATTIALPAIRRAFPSVPWIFLYRSPDEVLISQLKEPAAAMSPGIVTDANVLAFAPRDSLSLTAEEYAARVLGRLCECAARALDDRGMLVNYTQLPEALWSAVAPHFGVRFSDQEIARMSGAARFHAKRPTQQFVADAETKRLELSASAKEAAARWILPHYEALERLRHSPQSAG